MEEGVESRQVISWNSTSRLFSQNQERMSSFPLGQNNIAVADPGLQIRGEGEGEGGSLKEILSALRASIWSKTSPSPGSASAECLPSRGLPRVSQKFSFVNVNTVYKRKRII